MTGELAFPKFKDGKTLQEERKATRIGRKKHEDQIRATVKSRDRYRCRIPGCTDRDPAEWCHLNHRGSGGNPKGDRSTTQDTLCLCHLHHQGPHSLDSGDIEVIPLTKAGCDGPLAFHFIWTGETRKEAA